MPPLVRDLIEGARVRHWAFTDVELGDGAALLFLNRRQRAHLAEHGANIEGIVGESIAHNLEVAATGTVVALDDDGVPYYSSTTDSGYAVRFDDDVPYIDTDADPLTLDPFGEDGGTPGFPLPRDFVRLINVMAVYQGNRTVPVDVIAEQERHERQPNRNPAAFVSGNRLVPVMPLSEGNTGTVWHSLVGLHVSYVNIQTLTALTDVVALPTVLCEALEADLALLFARQSRTVDKADKASFEREAATAAAAVRDAGLDMLDSVTKNSVLYRG